MQLLLKDGEIRASIEALDFYSRMFLGQYDEIDFIIRMYSGFSEKYMRYEFARKHIYTAMRNLVFPEDPDIAEWDLNGSLGIWSARADDRAKSAYDMQQVIRYADSWCRVPEGDVGISFGKPNFRGTLSPIQCECNMEGDVETALIYLNAEHINILMDAINVYWALIEIRISDVMDFYTTDQNVMSLAKIVEDMYDICKTDKTKKEKIDTIKSVMDALNKLYSYYR